MAGISLALFHDLIKEKSFVKGRQFQRLLLERKEGTVTLSFLDPQFKSSRARSCIYSVFSKFYALDLKDSEIKMALGLLSESVDALPKCFWTARISNLHFQELICEIGRGYEEQTKDERLNYASLLFPAEAGIPPFETFYRSPSERRACLESIEITYSLSSFTAPPSRELPDHIASELHFLHVLSSHEAESILEGDIDSTAQCRSLQSIFLWKHLRAWLPGFNRATGTAHSSKFLASLAQAVDLFTELDAMYLSSLSFRDSDLFTELDSIFPSSIGADTPLVFEKK